jgi:hypothetical protein
MVVSTRLRAADQDTLATQFQLLTRELDRETNWIEFRPSGATKSVYIRTYRTDIAAVRPIPVAVGMFDVRFELLTDPYAIGLRETVSVGTVNNDPAAGSNGCYFDVTGVIGDVAVPAVIVDASTTAAAGVVGVRQNGTPSNINVAFLQGESFTGGSTSGFANPGGAADAAMSGASTTNYVRSSTATPYIGWDTAGTDAQMIASRGSYRVLAVVRMSDATTDWVLFRGQSTTDGNPQFAVPRSTSRQIVDVGIWTIGEGITAAGVSGLTAPMATAVQINLGASRTTGAATIDIDYIALIPADESQLVWDTTFTASESLFDSWQESITAKEAGVDPFGGTGYLYNVTPASGGFPYLVPNQTNRLYWHKWTVSGSVKAIAKSTTSSITVYYNPGYTFVRPSAT